MFLTENYPGNLHTAAGLLNKYNVALNVHSIHPVSPGATVVVFYFGDYPAYKHYCSKVRREIQPPEKFFAGEL